MIHFKSIDKKTFTNVYGIQVGSAQTNFVHSDLTSYEKAGFHKLPDPYLGGIAGPQHVMEKHLRKFT